MLYYNGKVIDHSGFGSKSRGKQITSMLLVAIAAILFIWTAGCILIATAVHFGEINPGKGAFLGGLILKSFKEIAAAIIIATIMAISGTIIASGNE